MLARANSPSARQPALATLIVIVASGLACGPAAVTRNAPADLAGASAAATGPAAVADSAATADSTAAADAAARAAAAATPAPPSPALRIRAVGDVMLGTASPSGDYLPPDDGAQTLDAVRHLLGDADLTFANLEGPLCDEGESDKCQEGENCYAFRSPSRYARYLRDAGVDLVSLANNHAMDFGAPCLRRTEAVLDSLGIGWSGPPGTSATVERGGLRVAMIAFHSAPTSNFSLDLEGAAAAVRALKSGAGHDIVIVSVHGGAEGAGAMHVPQGSETYLGEDRGDLRAFAHAVVDAGADLVIGHGPHVPRAMEIYQHRLIAYSLGNFATYARFKLAGPNGAGPILEVTVDATGRFAGGRIFSTRQVGEGVPQVDESGEAARLVGRLSNEDFPATGVRVDADGTLRRR